MNDHATRKQVLCAVTLAGLAGWIAAFGGGCGPDAVRVDLEALQTDKAEMIGYYLPRQIEILPFTKVASFDDDAIPEGLEAVVRPTDVLGDPVKAYGLVRFEIYTFRPASGVRHGDRLMVWQRVLARPEGQSRHWDRVTQTYQFQLAWQQPLEPNAKYVLEVVYETPTGLRLFDDFVFEFAPNIEQIRHDLREAAR